MNKESELFLCFEESLVSHYDLKDLLLLRLTSRQKLLLVSIIYISHVFILLFRQILLAVSV